MERVKIVTLAQWVRYHLMARLDSTKYLHHANKVYQHLIVDEWEKAEMQQMTWMKCNHHTIRADLYKGLKYLLHAGDVANSE